MGIDNGKPSQAQTTLRAEAPYTSCTTLDLKTVSIVKLLLNDILSTKKQVLGGDVGI